MMTLVVFELVPEDMLMYLIPNSEISDEHRRVLEGAHRKMINADDETEDALRLMNMLGQSSAETAEERQEEGIWEQYKVNQDNPVRDTHVTFIYASGFHL